jgi:hypothetical protein
MSDHLARAAKTRHDTAHAKAETALRELAERGQPISFASVARQAGVSTDFLYRQPTLRARISSLRSRPGSPTAPVEVDDTSSTSAVVRALSTRIKDLTRQHRQEVAALQRGLAAAHGENLLLRRRLAAYEDVVS